MAVNGQEIVDYLKKFLGTPYAWGGNSLTSGVDCSGLVQQGFKNFGIELPRTTYTQIGEGQGIGAKGLRPGDLVFFDTNPNVGGPDHVGVYAGGGKMIHAPRPGKSVEISDMTTNYWMGAFMGGRRISGVHAKGSSSSDFATQEESVKMTPEELAASYGWAAGFLNSTPELKKLFSSAVKGTWTQDKFQAELRDTKWWKSTSETRRKAQVMKKTDPATWNASISAATIQVQQLAGEIGASIPQSKLKKIATTAVETGMDEDQLRYALGQYVTFTRDGMMKGEAAMHEYVIKEYAYNNGVKVSDDTIKNQAQRIVRKIATTEDYKDEIRTQAKSMFPSYEKEIDAGMTVRDIASPYIQMMSGELELPESSIDVMNPLIKRALNGVDANDKPGGVALYDFQAQLRNDPRWRGTQKAQNSAMAVSQKVLTDMGLIAEG